MSETVYLSKKDAAAACGCDKTTIQHYNRNKKLPNARIGSSGEFEACQCQLEGARSGIEFLRSLLEGGSLMARPLKGSLEHKGASWMASVPRIRGSQQRVSCSFPLKEKRAPSAPAPALAASPGADVGVVGAGEGPDFAAVAAVAAVAEVAEVLIA